MSKDMILTLSIFRGIPLILDVMLYGLVKGIVKGDSLILAGIGNKRVMLLQDISREYCLLGIPLILTVTTINMIMLCM